MVFSKKQVRFSMADKHCLVTGGAQGIGLEISRTLISRGAASVAVLDISEAGLHAAAQDLRSEAGSTKIATFKVDVTREEEVQAACQAAVQQFGTLDVVFANAGIGPGGGILDRDSSFYQKMMAVNFFGVVHTIKATLPVLVAKKTGNIIVTNSTAGFAGSPGLSAYSASKFAVRGLIESVRLETPELRKLFDKTATLMTPATVSKYIVDGVEEGNYILRSPNWGVDFVISGCLVPRSPRPYHLIVDIFLAPLYVIGHWYVTRTLNQATQHILRRTSSSMRAAGEATRTLARKASSSFQAPGDGDGPLTRRASSGLHSVLSSTGPQLYGRSSSGLRAAIDTYHRDLLAQSKSGTDTEDAGVKGSARSRSWVAVSIVATLAVAMIAAVMSAVHVI